MLNTRHDDKLSRPAKAGAGLPERAVNAAPKEPGLSRAEIRRIVIEIVG
jgi:hypothetical protein